MNQALTVAFGVIVLLIYFLPSIAGRKHPHAGGIFVINLFLGWTFLGWVGALAWAMSGTKRY
jgi:hypothetical protein